MSRATKSGCSRSTPRPASGPNARSDSARSTGQSAAGASPDHRAQGHIAIVDPISARQLAAGAKRIESRFSQTRRLPFGRIHPGDPIWFKLSGGGFIGAATARRVQEFSDLTVDRVRGIARRHGRDIAAPDGYWDTRLTRRYGVLIWISRLRLRLEPPAVTPRQYGSGWILL